MLSRCIDAMTAGLSAKLPEYGRDIAVDGSDMPTYAKGQRFKYNHGPGARALLRPGRELGSPQRGQHPQGRRFYAL